MLEEVSRLLTVVDVVVMAAAVADFRADEIAGSKLKKSEKPEPVSLNLLPTTDILASIVRARTSASPYIVGFAAETGDADASVLEHGRAKLARKGCDLLVVNDVSPGKAFGSDDNEIVILAAGTELAVPKASKAAISDSIWDAVLAGIAQR
jgi:phosphopantothenoylcysteine decarboxylase/phosphopantothenate--cysteine ligase